MGRKTLKSIRHYPSPKTLYKKLTSSQGWEYKTRKEFYKVRDLSLPSLLYLGDFRIVEVLPIKKSQFILNTEKKFVHLIDVKVAKRKKGTEEYRDARLPLEGERACFTQLILNYLELLKPDERLYKWSLKEATYTLTSTYTLRDGTTKQRVSTTLVGTHRAYQIVNSLLPEYTQHWLRAFGYDYDYDVMDHDILAVADKTKASARTLEKYIRKRHTKYPVR